MLYRTNELYTQIKDFITATNLFAYTNINYGQFDYYFKEHGIKIKGLGLIEKPNEIINLPAISITLIENIGAKIFNYFRSKEKVKLELQIYLSNLNANTSTIQNITFIDTFIKAFQGFNFTEPQLISKPKNKGITEPFNTSTIYTRKLIYEFYIIKDNNASDTDRFNAPINLTINNI